MVIHNPLPLPEETDTLKLRFAIRTVKSEDILAASGAVLTFLLYDVNTGLVLKNIDNRAIVKSTNTTSELYEISMAASGIQSSLQGRALAIRPSVTGVGDDMPGIMASLGHVYRYESDGTSELQRGALVDESNKEGYRLEPNYPNPFNPSTTIRYGLPVRSHVSLTVFNTLGQQVATLVNGEMEAGYHDVKFDASRLPSGVYLYRLQAGNHIEVRKALLMK